MNAHELADELESYVWMNPNNNRDYCKEVKDMLRQQADRIAELSKNVDELEEELLKATHPNAEPVAWMSPDSKFSKTEGKLFYIPLYTTPQIKELSDEEIQDLIINKVTDADMIRQALRKASEK